MKDAITMWEAMGDGLTSPWHLVLYIEEIGELMFIHLPYQEKIVNHEDLWIQSPSPSR